MRFPFFRKKGESGKVEEIALDDVRRMLEDELRKRKDKISGFEARISAKIGDAVEELIELLDSIDYDDVPQRLVSQAKDFVFAMRNLWENFNGSIDDASKKVEIWTAVRFKRFRALSAANSQDLKRMDEIMKEVAEIVKKAKEERLKSGLPEVIAALGKIEEIESLKRELEIATMEIETLKRKKSERDVSSYDVYGEEYEKVKEKLGEVESELRKKEGEINRKLALVKKPLRIYAHMVGERFQDNVFEMRDVERLASGTLEGLVKGEIKLKKGKSGEIIKVLEELASGALREKYDEVLEMRREIVRLKNEMKRLEAVRKSESKGIQGVEREIERLEKKATMVESRIYVAKMELEKMLETVANRKIEVKI